MEPLARAGHVTLCTGVCDPGIAVAGGAETCCRGSKLDGIQGVGRSTGGWQGGVTHVDMEWWDRTREVKRRGDRGQGCEGGWWG